MKCKFSTIEKKQLKIFFIVAFLVPMLLGVLMGYSYYQGNKVDLFALTFMLYPAAGVILAIYFTKDKDAVIPQKAYATHLVTTVLLTVITIVNIFKPSANLDSLSQVIILVASALFLIFVHHENPEIKKKYNLNFRGHVHKKPWIYMLLFVLLYITRIVFIAVFDGDLESINTLFSIQTLLGTLNLTIAFVFSFIMFFGEEYGWRYFLQPFLQKRMGKRLGIITLGVIWGLWHLPIIMFLYSTETWCLGIIGQLSTCISLAIFFGYAYMKTKNIWVPIFMHFFNNNFIAVLVGNVDFKYTLQLKDVVILLISNAIIYASFIFAKEYKANNTINHNASL